MLIKPALYLGILMKKVIFIFTHLGANSHIFENINYNRIQFFKTAINYENYSDIEKLLEMSHQVFDISAMYAEIFYDNFRFTSKRILKLPEVASVFYFENPQILLSNILKNVSKNKLNSKFSYYLKYYETRLYYMKYYMTQNSLCIKHNDLNLNQKLNQYLGVNINLEIPKDKGDEVPTEYIKSINKIYDNYLI